MTANSDTSASRLAYEATGSGEPILLLHGLGGRRRVWYQVAPILARRHRVIAVDLPGFGESPPFADPDAPVIPAQADAIERLLDELGIGSAHIVGNSLGGWLALELARRERARSVFVLSPAGLWNWGEARWFWGVMTAHRAGAKLGRPFARLLMCTGPMRTALFWLIHSRGSLISPEDGVETLRNFAGAPGFGQIRRWCGSRQVEGLEEIDCPVVIGWGSRDLLLRPRQGHRFTERIAHARLIELPKLGHVPMSDDPALIAHAILDDTTAKTSETSTTRAPRASKA